MAHETEQEIHHPSFKQYLLIAIILFAITIVEFLLIWDRVGISDDLGASKIPLLVGLSVVKFYIVIMFYMHLRFDDKLFTRIFIAGLALAFLVGLALLGLFTAMNGDQRSYALDRAVPYEEHAETEKAAEETTTPATGETTETETTPIVSGPVAIAIGAVGETLAFDTASITADSGAEVTITFTNPSANNQHNLVIVEAGTKDAVAADGTAAGPANDWVPPGDARVVANTKLLDPGASGEVTFTAPAPGTYQFVCTFPGHNFTMFGDFVVN
jgi:azurin